MLQSSTLTSHPEWKDPPSPVPPKPGSAPISERLPMPSAQELDDAFNFMFSQDQALDQDDPDEEDTEDDEQTIEDELQRSLFSFAATRTT